MAMILDAFVGTFVEKLTSMASEKVVMVLGVKDELKKLQQLMARIQKFLEAAERRRLGDDDIKHWVGELKDVAYDADDIIDRCTNEGAPLSLADRPSSSKKLTVCFDFSLLSACFTSVPHRYKIAKSIKVLNDKLEEIYKARLQFKLEESREQPKLQTITTVNTLQTSPLVDVDVLGTEIEEATKELVKLIVAEQAKKCRVIALTGMGGIGKTTLAQKIYNNKKIQTEFQNKVWVCVSQNYNEEELLRQVIVKGAEGDHGDTRNKTEDLPKTKTELLPLLQSAYHGKSLFLVLDDVWRADVWIDLFRSPLQSAVAFLRIFVTTRDENIARGLKAAHIHPVEQLSDQIGWEILCKKVFLDGEETEIGKLKDIGVQIVKKCSGLPLAVKAIAGVLAKKEKNIREWEKVLKNDAWSMKNLPEELRGGLYLSYDDLPSNLKQCFLYCSLFPEDASIDSYDLVRLWVAEGFIKEQNDSLVEDVAEELYTELIRRNLLQVDYFLHLFGAWKCKMHDLMRSLAKFLSQDEIFSGMTIAATTPSSSTKLRRLSIETPESLLPIKDLVVEQKCLRTLLTFNGIKVLNDSLLVGLEHLRVLRINNNDINNIPDSIGDLIHLRYLNLVGTKIRELPESIGSLINLQFLYLSGCTFLTTLPKSITRLHNLRCLHVEGTPLISIPKGISKLEKINNFRGFVVADPGEPEDSYTSLEELLNSLYQLRVLNISRMERARSGALSLQKLCDLIQLELRYITDQALTTEEDITRIEDALEELCPPECLERLFIFNFFGTHYPSWMKSPSFGHRLPHLTSLQCTISCPQLPPAGELPQLTDLMIHKANLVKSIGSEFLGAGVCDTHTTTRTAFPNLQFLSLYEMPELEEWSFNNEKEGFERGREMAHVLPHLNILDIDCCPKLKTLPKGLEQCKIKILFIKKADSLKEVENLHTVEEMKIVKNQNLERVSNLPALYQLHVKECPSLNYVEKLDSLQRLKLSGFDVKGIPKWLERLLEERKPANVDDDFCLTIYSDDTTLLRFLKGGPDWSIIVQIPRFIAYNREGILVMRYTKNPFTYTTYEVPE